MISILPTSDKGVRVVCLVLLVGSVILLVAEFMVSAKVFSFLR